MNSRPNFYVLLELDPTEHRLPLIERCIAEKKKGWSQKCNMGSPKVRRTAKANLDLLPEIKKVMTDPRLRQREAEDARQTLQDERKKNQSSKAAELEECVHILQDTGFCQKEQFENLLSQFAEVYDAEYIRTALTRAGIAVAGLATEKLDAPTVHAISANLEHLGLENLFEFLSLDPQSAHKVLYQKADEVEVEYRRLGKTDPYNTARGELASMCKLLFQDDRGYRRYMNHLVVQVMGEFRQKIDLIAASGQMTGTQLSTLMDQASSRGVTPLEARAFIEGYAREKNIMIFAPPPRVPVPVPPQPQRQVSSELQPKQPEQNRVETEARQEPREPPEKWTYFRALTFPFRQKQPGGKLFWLAFMAYIPFGVVILHGWRQDVMRRVGTNQSTSWPKGSDFGRFLGDGIVLWLTAATYCLPPIFVSFFIISQQISQFWYGIQQNPGGQLQDLFTLWLFVIFPWLVYQAGKIRYAATGRPMTMFNVPANLALLFSNPFIFFKIVFFISVTWAVVIFLGFMVAGVVPILGLLLVPGICVPLYYWVSGYTLGKLAPATVWTLVEQ